jgi:hypothetical protein
MTKEERSARDAILKKGASLIKNPVKEKADAI